MQSGVTAVVCTKNRHGILPQALLSIVLQTVKPEHLIILDDSEEQFGSADALVQRYPAYGEIFQLLQEFKISWQVVFGERRGQHCLHQAAQEIAKTDWLWRIDDDEVAEPDVLAKLLSRVEIGVGAVGGLVLSPSPLPCPDNAANIISDLNLPNVQWFKQSPKLLEVDHLHSTFLYRRGIANYELSLSPAAHREETLFSYSIKRKGFKVLVDTSAVTWHFRAPTGGIRSHTDPGFWNHDENVFGQRLLDWGVVKPRPEKIIVLDAGRGDHVIIKKLVPKIKKRWPDCMVASCFPDILNGDLPQISIQEARRNLGNLENHSIYGWCEKNNWTGNLEDAFSKMYDLE
jgi:glycosyltransferase involved in cell wall biosynthesis